MFVVVFIGSNLDDVVLAMQVQRYPVIHVLRENIKMKKAAAAARDVALAPCHLFFWWVAWKSKQWFTGTNPINHPISFHETCHV